MAARRPPSFVTLLALLTLAGSLGATWWFFNPPVPEPQTSIPPEQLDVYCSGRVDAAGQVIALEPAEPGRVTAVHITEGQRVTQDQPLIDLDATVAVHRVAQAEAVLTLAELELAQARRAEGRFPNQLAARAASVKAAQFRVEAGRQSLAQRKIAANSGPPLGSAELAGLEAQIASLEELEAGERAGLVDLESQRPELVARIQAAQARLASGRADLVAAQKARADCVLRAPADGVVLRLQATVGGLISPGSPVPALVFAPAGDYVVRAEIDQESVARVTEGLPAEIRDENSPTGTVWLGSVRTLAGWVAQKRSAVLEPGEISDVRTVECVINLQPNNERLWIGQRMRVLIMKRPPSESKAASESSR